MDATLMQLIYVLHTSVANILSYLPCGSERDTMFTDGINNPATFQMQMLPLPA